MASFLRNFFLSFSILAILATSGSLSAHESCRDKIKAHKIVVDNLRVKNKLIVKKVENDIGATYVVGVDIPTIQAGIDLASSGLKPESASKPPLELGAKNVTIQIPPGTYHETLFIDTSLSIPVLNESESNIFSTQGRGLRIIGDTRPIAAMTYMKGGLMATYYNYAQDSGLNSLGTLYGKVDLITYDNAIEVTTLGGNPNFEACGVIPGDIIVVTDIDGTAQQRKIKSVSGNTITYNKTPVSISGNGASLTFCPNVHIKGSSPDGMCLITDGAVEMEGIWFSIESAFPNAGYGVQLFGTSQLYGSRLLFDARNMVAVPIALACNFGSQIIVTTEGDLGGHMSLIGGSVDLSGQANITLGDWYIMTNKHPGGCLHLSADNSLNGIDSVQISSNGTGTGLALVVNANAEIYILSVFNANYGIAVENSCNVTLEGHANIDTCVYGIYIENGKLTCLSFAGSPLTLSNCVGAILLYNDAQLVTNTPIIINNCIDAIAAYSYSQLVADSPITITSGSLGILLQYGSTFTSTDSVSFNPSNYLYPYAIDGSSTYLTPNNAGTDPSPNNIYTYSLPGSTSMNSAYLDQILDSGTGVSLQLDPTTSVQGVDIYQGKTYTLYAASGTNTLTLGGGAKFQDNTSVKTIPSGGVLTIKVVSDTLVFYY